jgi:hypothetical protein
MAFKMRGFSGFKQTEKVTPEVKTSTTDKDGTKYYTYETTLYDYNGNVVKDLAEENLSEVKTDEGSGEEYATVLYDTQSGHKKGDVIWYSKPKHLRNK